jgi:glucokinase
VRPAKAPEHGYVAGVDIGGSMLKAALLTASGRQLALCRMPTPAGAEPPEVADLLVATVRRLASDADRSLEDLVGVGVSIAAFITADGTVTATAHLPPQWVGCNFRALLMPRLSSRYYFALDTPAPALGEAYYGAGRGLADFAYVTVSTGIGAGIVSQGRIFIGGTGWAGGVGHVIVEPGGPRRCDGCGNSGCLETYAARQGILGLAAEELARFPGSRLHEMADSLTPRSVYEAAVQGDAAAGRVFDRAGYYLGLGLTHLINILSPSRVVVGGGIAQAGDLLLEPARRVVAACAFPPPHRAVPVVPAELGDLSGVYGAGAMVFHDIRVNQTDMDLQSHAH